jgi:formate hydrogenlyase subunit 4
MKPVIWQILQIVLVIGVSPLITGWVRLVKARLNGRRGASAV